MRGIFAAGIAIVVRPHSQFSFGTFAARQHLLSLDSVISKSFSGAITNRARVSACSCCEWYLGTPVLSKYRGAAIFSVGAESCAMICSQELMRQWLVRRILCGVSFGFVFLIAWGQRNSELNVSNLAFITSGKSLCHCIIPGCPVIPTARLRFVPCLLPADHSTLVIHTFSLWLLGRVNEMWCTEHSARCLAQSRHGTNNNSCNFWKDLLAKNVAVGSSMQCMVGLEREEKAIW